MVSKEELIGILRQEMNRQRAIWNKYAGRVINPDNSPQYNEAKKAFDDAHEKMRLLDNEIARLITHQGEYDPAIGDRVASYWQRMGAGTDPQQKGPLAPIGGKGSKELQKLENELHQQRAIFEKHAPTVINPSNDPAYGFAKKRFDAADKRIKELEKEIAKLRHPTDGVQLQPSQSKVILDP